MSFEVDVAGVAPITISSNCVFGGNPPISLEVHWPGEIAVGQWFSPALQVNNNNPPGASVQITSQAPILNSDGSQGLLLTIANVSNIDCSGNHASDSIEFTINILSTPSHF